MIFDQSPHLFKDFIDKIIETLRGIEHIPVFYHTDVILKEFDSLVSEHTDIASVFSSIALTYCLCERLDGNVITNMYGLF